MNDTIQPALDRVARGVCADGAPAPDVSKSIKMIRLAAPTAATADLQQKIAACEARITTADSVVKAGLEAFRCEQGGQGIHPQIDRFNVWLQTATPDALERAERALEAGIRRVGGRYREARLEAGRWHWMHREVIKKRGQRDYCTTLIADGYAVTTVYDQIRDWLDSQNYTLPIETLPDQVNPREQAIKAAIVAAAARQGRARVAKPQLNGHVRIPWPVLFAMRDDIDRFGERCDTNEATEILLEAFRTIILLDQFQYEENIDVDFSMQL